MAPKLTYHQTILTVTVERRRAGRRTEFDSIELKRRSTRAQEPLDTKGIAEKLFGERSLPALTVRNKGPGKK